MGGAGFLKTSLVADRTAIVRCQASNPLKLLTPKRPGFPAWVYTSTFGGGLVAGDQTTLQLEIAAGTTCVLGSQASTKVYKSPGGLPSKQLVNAQIAESALLVSVPDPITCFAQAVYEQRQQFELSVGANLVLVDWVTSGRQSRNECWQFSRYSSRIDVQYGAQSVFLESLLLDPEDGELTSPFRLGRFRCMALLLLVGPALQKPAQQLLDRVAAEPITKGCAIVEAASPIPFGVAFRVLGTVTENVGYVLRDQVDFLAGLLGESPWSRKW